MTEMEDVVIKRVNNQRMTMTDIHALIAVGREFSDLGPDLIETDEQYVSTVSSLLASLADALDEYVGEVEKTSEEKGPCCWSPSEVCAHERARRLMAVQRVRKAKAKANSKG